MSGRIPKNVQPLDFEEVVYMALTYGYISDEKEAYCKDCGEPLTNGAIIWKNMKIGWNFSGNRFQSDNLKKTFLHYRRYGLTNYRLCRCDKCIKKKFPEYKGNLCSMSANYVQYAFDVADVDFIPMQRKACVRSLDSFIEKYGEETGKQKWDAYCKRQSEVNTFEYKAKTYGWTKEEFDSYNKSRAVTLENLVKKYGEDEGTRRFHDYCARQAYTCSREYFLESAPDYETGLQRYNAFVEARTQSGFKLQRSVIGDKFCQMLQIALFWHKCQYGNNEKKVGEYHLDFYDETANVAVEFYGDYWHRNPDKFDAESTYTLGGKIYRSVDKWESDRKRKEFIESELGCTVIVVWESDFRKDPERTVMGVQSKILKKLEQ